MKKRFLLVLMVLMGLGVNAQEGGYKGPGMSASTVAEALNLRDDAPVTLHGKIERFLGDEKYLFSDNTGSIVIEIDKKKWRGLEVDQNDVVEITGEIERKHFKPREVEVETIRKL